MNVEVAIIHGLDFNRDGELVAAAAPRPNPVIDFIRVSYQSPRSGWKDNAWGERSRTPGWTANKKSERAKRAKVQNPESLCSMAVARFAGLTFLTSTDPGVRFVSPRLYAIASPAQWES